MQKIKSKYLQIIFLILGISFLLFGFFEAVLEHMNDFSRINFVLIFSGFLFTYLLVTYFTHNHVHKAEIKGLVLTEFLHSIIDGAVIGFAYFINPLLGVGTLLSVLGHELPKILGTYLIIKSEIKSNLKALEYLIYSQIGLPFSALVFFFLGKNIDEKYAEYLEAIALASLLAIMIRLILNTIKLHKHNH
jgi:zinc transporter ZupT